MTIELNKFEIPVSDQAAIRGDLRYQAGSISERPLVIIAHGFKGFKDHSFFPYLGEKLAEDGFVTIVFNFSHNGIGSDSQEFDRLDLFKNNTFKREQDDLKILLDKIESRAITPSSVYRPNGIGLVGHSRGGVAVLTTGARDSRVRAVATLASLAHFPEFSKEDIDRWREEGVYYVENKRTGQMMPLGTELLEEMLSQPDMIENAAKNLNKPLLVIHGDSDETVPVAAANKLAAWAADSQLTIIKGAGHTFGAVHPFSGPTAELNEVVKELSRFFGKTL
ncbi:MAG: alpha/beta fold hydrolase [Candidatus Dadabacteria bacterium]|nr:MAG: alpha/beta fold hydrolase [Candidatus Dadabacteria bacterium]